MMLVIRNMILLGLFLLIPTLCLAEPSVKMTTNYGTITIELDEKNAPLSTSNFLRYVDDGFYNGTIFQ